MCAFVWVDIERWWGFGGGLHASSFAEFGLERRNEARQKLAQKPETTATVVWIWLPLGSVISNALFCVIKAEAWNLMPFFQQ